MNLAPAALTLEVMHFALFVLIEEVDRNSVRETGNAARLPSRSANFFPVSPKIEFPWQFSF